MLTVWNIVSLSLKTFLRHKLRIIMLFALIALLCAAIAVAANTLLTQPDFTGTISIAVVDLDRGFETRMIVTAVTEMSDYGDLLEFIIFSQDEASAALADGSVNAVITLPEGFGESMVRGENIPFAVDYNRNRPLMSALVRIAADSFADMLRFSQMGIYSALRFARTQDLSPEDYNTLLLGINMRYIGLVLNRADMFKSEVVYVTGDFTILQSYFIAAYITLMMCAAYVMTDVVRLNFKNRCLIRLRARGITPGLVFLSCVISYFLLFIALNIGLYICFALLQMAIGMPIFALGAGYLIGAAVTAVVMAAFASMLTFAFDNALSAGIFTAAFAGVSLFLSGGIIPRAYFSESVQFFGNAVFNTWGTRLFSALQMQGDLLAPILGCIVFTLIFAGFGFIHALQRGRVKS